MTTSLDLTSCTRRDSLEVVAISWTLLNSFHMAPIGGIRHFVHFSDPGLNFITTCMPLPLYQLLAEMPLLDQISKINPDYYSFEDKTFLEL